MIFFFFFAPLFGNIFALKRLSTFFKVIHCMCGCVCSAYAENYIDLNKPWFGTRGGGDVQRVSRQQICIDILLGQVRLQFEIQKKKLHVHRSIKFDFRDERRRIPSEHFKVIRFLKNKHSRSVSRVNHAKVCTDNQWKFYKKFIKYLSEIQVKLSKQK